MCALSLSKLKGGDLRSIAGVNQLLPEIKTQKDFDALFELIFSDDRLEAMRAIDAVEKLSAKDPAYIIHHKNALLNLLPKAENKEFKWHLAQLICYVKLTRNKAEKAWQILEKQVRDKKESRIVRATSVTALFQITKQFSSYKNAFETLVEDVYVENIPSLNARIRQFKL